MFEGLLVFWFIGLFWTCNLLETVPAITGPNKTGTGKPVRKGK